MYKIYLSNLGYFYHTEYATLDEAKKCCQGLPYDCQVYVGQQGQEELVATYSYFAGFRLNK